MAGKSVVFVTGNVKKLEEVGEGFSRGAARRGQGRTPYGGAWR